MHEVGIAQEIVSIASDAANGGSVKRIIVEIGAFTAVLPDAIRFCFDVCAEGTAAFGATLDIVEIEGRGQCRACGHEQAFRQPFGLCRCGQSEFDWLQGDELRVKRVEVD